MWFILMLLAWMFNGLGVFGLRILAGFGLSGDVTNPYIMYWYLGGTIFMGVRLLAKRCRPDRKEVLLGGLMALCSVSGTAGLAFALNVYSVPGNVAFPIANGGSLFVVVTAGVLLFRERLGLYGVCGCTLGTLAIILLSVS
jgi:multidrug transporter EmrE-like cation transporter